MTERERLDPAETITDALSRLPGPEASDEAEHHGAEAISTKAAATCDAVDAAIQAWNDARRAGAGPKARQQAMWSALVQRVDGAAPMGVSGDVVNGPPGDAVRTTVPCPDVTSIAPTTTLRDLVADAIAAEWRRRAAAQVEGSPEDHARALADAVLGALTDAGRLLPEGTYTEVEYQHGTEQRTVWVGPWGPVDEDEPVSEPVTPRTDDGTRPPRSSDRVLLLAYDALIEEPDRCRYHDTNFAFLGMEYGLPRCDSCKQPYRVTRALDAVRRALGMEPVR